MLKITLRTVCETQHVDIVDNAIRARESASTVAQEASGYQADEAAALDNANVGQTAEIGDPKPGCWMCQTPGDQLRVCRGCNKVTQEKCNLPVPS